MGAPYEVKAGLGGKRGYDPKTMAAIVIMKTLTKKL